MNSQKSQKSIFLCKQGSETNHQGFNKTSRLNDTSRSRSRLRDSLARNTSNAVESRRINPQQYAVKNKPHLAVTNMEDPQKRIQRSYSPLYQNSSRQSSLFEKGLKKYSGHSCAKSRVQITDRGTKGDEQKRIQKSYRNKQQDNFLDLSKYPPQSIQISHKSRRVVADPNRQTLVDKTDRSKVSVKYTKDKNRETQETADHVIRALSTHVANGSRNKEVHLKFHKKGNPAIDQNFKNQKGLKETKQVERQHKRHYSEMISTANKQNIEVRLGGICLKEQVSVKRKQIDFTQDFYKKGDRMGKNESNKLKNEITQKLVTQRPIVNKMGLLRKKFF